MTTIKNQGVQGEGDYEAARRYRKGVENFVATHDVEAAARDAAPKSPAEAEELRAAEARGKSRSKASRNQSSKDNG